MREFRRTCQACGKVWHSLVSREQQLKSREKQNTCFTCGTMCDPSAHLQAGRNLDANKSEIARLRQCPNCGSAAYIEQIITYNVQPPTR